MAKRFWIACSLFFLCVGAASAQDAKTVLQAAQKAMGDVNSIEYSGTGHLNAFGQSWVSTGAWPVTNLTSYTKTIDYTTKSAKEEPTHSEPVPMIKGGGRPFGGDDKQVHFVSGQYAWDMPGGAPIPNLGAAAEWQLQIWLTPEGFVKGAMENNATAKKGPGGTIVTFMDGKYKVVGTIDAQNMVTKTETWVNDPDVGDKSIVTTFSDYKDFSGVKFPTMIVQKQEGFPTLELNVTSVKVNPGLSVSVPESVKTATMPQVHVAVQKLGDGIWFLGGGSHNSLVVEFPTYLAVIEGPLGDARSDAVMAEAKKLVPNKPIKYLINSHHHFDHLGGVRAYVAAGATIITNEANVAYYQKLFNAKHDLDPDDLAKSPKEATIIPVKEKYVLKEGDQSIEIYHTDGDYHAEDMMFMYLPKAKVLVEADDFTPPTPQAPAPTGPRPGFFSANLMKNVQRLKLDVTTIAPLHGVVVPFSDFQKEADSGQKVASGKG
jgi:glyoxylase-like metal-dependent hydrolase (beta-lactamase superfamily II)